jgi:2-oxoglutarate dehydrogenase E2 component (dihydrolipoamide succinyltransferase)
MAKHEIVLPKMGEGIIEATINRWLKQVGDTVEEDDPVVEIATDKVDTEITAPVAGVLSKCLFAEGDVVAIGTVIAVLETESDSDTGDVVDQPSQSAEEPTVTKPSDDEITPAMPEVSDETTELTLTPLVRSMVKKEGITGDELRNIVGTGQGGRLTKRDLTAYLENRQQGAAPTQDQGQATAMKSTPVPPTVVISGNDTVIEMDRMRRLIADHMVMSKQVSPHVTSFIEVDMTKVVKWREAVKDAFAKREGAKLTYTPILIEATARAIRDLPGVNASVDGYKLILRSRVNIGMATLLPGGNLIVPVIKDADKQNLAGLAGTVNDLATRARDSKLTPDEIQGGTFTITNLGAFGSITGTPIINQPQVAILAAGTIRKMPAVVETPDGDMIAIRHKMILALTYDHRVVDGGLGGQFLQRVAQNLENFDTNRTA